MQQPPNNWQPAHPQQNWPPPPQRPPVRLKRRRLWIILGSVGGGLIFLCVICSVIAVLLPNTSAQISTPTATIAPTYPTHVTQALPTTLPTHLPTAKPTAKPTQPLKATSGEAILGSDIGPFITKYGQPTQMGTGAYDFQNHTIEVVITNQHHSFSILDNAPGNSNWSLSEAKSICLALSPHDATYVRHMTIKDGSGQPMAEQYVYYSTSLAPQFAAKDFTDEHSNPTKPGTFGIVLAYNPGSTSQFGSCSTQVGLQSV